LKLLYSYTIILEILFFTIVLTADNDSVFTDNTNDGFLLNSDSLISVDSLLSNDSISVTPLKPKVHRTVVNNAFTNGEFLHFTVTYGPVIAGYASISVDRKEVIRGRKCFVLKTTAKSRRAFDWVFKVRDWTESFIDIERFHSLRFKKHLREGSYKIDVDIEYFQDKNIASYRSERIKKKKKIKTKQIKIPDNVLDALGALFYVRTMDFKVGDEILIPATDNKKVYNIKVIIHRKEKIEVKAGTFNCFVVEPIMADGGVFKKDGKVKVWLTDDIYKMPVKMETKVYIGSIEAELDWFTRSNAE